jgi:hypothetical protein
MSLNGRVRADERPENYDYRDIAKTDAHWQARERPSLQSRKNVRFKFGAVCRNLNDFSVIPALASGSWGEACPAWGEMWVGMGETAARALTTTAKDPAEPRV